MVSLLFLTKLLKYVSFPHVFLSIHFTTFKFLQRLHYQLFITYYHFFLLFLCPTKNQIYNANKDLVFLHFSYIHFGKQLFEATSKWNNVAINMWFLIREMSNKLVRIHSFRIWFSYFLIFYYSKDYIFTTLLQYSLFV